MARVPPVPALRLDAAIGDLLAQHAQPAARVELEAMQAAVSDPDLPAPGLDPPTLRGALLDWIMPRLDEPGILRLERRRDLLERLAASFEAAGPDPLAQGGLLTVRHELKGLELLRGNRDSLIGG